MPAKKSSRNRIEKFSKIFFQIGLILTLFIVYQVLEAKTFIEPLAPLNYEHDMSDFLEETPPIVFTKEVEIPKQKSVKPIIDIVKIIENKEEQHDEIPLEIIDTEPESKSSNKFDLSKVVEIEIDTESKETVPFIAIEKVPVFPGCQGTQEELKKCFSESIKKFVVKRFDNSLANQLGLSEGKKRMVVLFKIDEKGNAIDVKAKSPHPRITKEIKSIVEELPKMTPGNQRGNPVRVSFTLPVVFIVD